MFGNYDLREFSIEMGELKISLERSGGHFVYRRELGDVVEKIIVASDAEIVINPVEPVNLPKNVTNFMLIEFERPIVCEPSSGFIVYATFPIEIGVLLSKGGSTEVLDVFSFQRPKYALYGDPRGGVICRYWRSNVYTELPELDWLREGAMRLRVENRSDEWLEIGKLVFNVCSMKVYYDDSAVFCSARASVLSKTVAETDFEALEHFNGRKSVELYVARRIRLGRKFVMEWGI